MNEEPVFVNNKYHLRRFLRDLNLDDSHELEKKSKEIIKYIKNVADSNYPYTICDHKAEYEKAISQLEEASSRGDFNGVFSDTLDNLINVLYGLKK